MNFSSPTFCALIGLLMARAVTAQSGSVMTHVVQVGDAQGSLKFFPEKIKANKGDLIQFQFFPKAHSVAQSTFDAPCEPIEKSISGTKGFWSGRMPVEMTNTTMPVFTVPVIDATKPMWFYCATGKHCQSGMVGVVNEPANKTLDTYKEKAKEVALAVEPSGTAAGGNASGSGSGASSNATVTGRTTVRPSEASSATVSGIPLPPSSGSPVSQSSQVMVSHGIVLGVLGLCMFSFFLQGL